MNLLIIQSVHVYAISTPISMRLEQISIFA